MGVVSYFRDAWTMFSPAERRNMGLYILGIMFYKLGLEMFNGSINTLATDRFGKQAFKKLGILQGLNQAFQCVGSILIAPLIKRFPTRTVLATSIMCFGLLTIILLIVDRSTGGELRNYRKANVYGDWNPDALFPVFCATGITYGMVELIRRVIPRDIVGGDVNKLRRMDSIVHVCYEIAGTSGAVATTYMVLRVGNNYSFIVTPIFFSIACICWSMVSALGFEHNSLEYVDKSYLLQVAAGFALFGKSIFRGAQIIFSGRKYVWLPLGYSLALYGHRYLENGVAPLIAKRVFNESAYSQILVSGSNLGELFGALGVFFTNSSIPTPIPWLRLDALLLLIVWVTPFYRPPQKMVKYAWAMAAAFVPISFGWAAGDVSLAAYIQASVARLESEDSSVSALGAVMAFLYSTYIVTYAILGSTLGRYIDSVWISTGSAKDALYNIAGVQFTVLSCIIILATLIPKGALSLNPALLFDEDLGAPLIPEDSEHKVDEYGLAEGGDTMKEGSHVNPNNNAAVEADGMPSTKEAGR